VSIFVNYELAEKVFRECFLLKTWSQLLTAYGVKSQQVHGRRVVSTTDATTAAVDLSRGRLIGVLALLARV